MGPGQGGIPVGGPVGATGGTVDRLFFAVTGDTRPDLNGSTPGPYPSTVIKSIFSGMKDKGVQFAVDAGDHMFVVGNRRASFDAARAQMGLYVDAAKLLGKTVFMTMGNHECSGGDKNGLCSIDAVGSNANYTAFMEALAPVSSLPYYRFDVQTQSGLAVFLIVADDVWDAHERTWLTTQLGDADRRAKYTFVVKHHPVDNHDDRAFAEIVSLVESHKYTLFITGHTHEYRHDRSNSRVLIVGCGGAPLDNAPQSWWGYITIEQGVDNLIYVTAYDQSSGMQKDSFKVAPQ